LARSNSPRKALKSPKEVHWFADDVRTTEKTTKGRKESGGNGKKSKVRGGGINGQGLIIAVDRRKGSRGNRALETASPRSGRKREKGEVTKNNWEDLFFTSKDIYAKTAASRRQKAPSRDPDSEEWCSRKQKTNRGRGRKGRRHIPTQQART